MLKFLTSPIFIFVIIALFCFTPVRSEYNSSVSRSSANVNVDGATFAINLCAGKAPSKPASCQVKCFWTNPVCGADGVTYWCGCAEAMCAGTRVAKLGFCEVGIGGSAPLSGQALLLVHIIWLIVLGFSVLFGLF